MHMCVEIPWSSFLIGHEQLTCNSNAAKVEKGYPITGGERRGQTKERQTEKETREKQQEEQSLEVFLHQKAEAVKRATMRTKHWLFST